ncbi:MAG: 16S rRNA (cytosine(1402)-N(4))-methyltransferase RsmH [Acidobacteria bacterium]|nr:MAG: 16S rRNA (cytosine(1402)-N(4))-methyltransferase RsmH [Acidobacteriota bacterium]
MAETGHVAVMAEELLDYLAPRRDGVYVDCTVGAGGHSLRVAQAIGSGRLFGCDKDPVALEAARKTLAAVPGVEFTAWQGDFAGAPEELRRRGVEQVDGVIADLGMSSMQLDAAERGFSFSADGPLDMRMDPRQELTAEQVVNQTDERTLADLIFQYGEERRSRRIARAIVRARPLQTTRQLADLVAAASGAMKERPRRLHPATRTFQALRIYVNQELSSLSALLASLPGWLKPGGRAVILAFHSLEDRPVKQSFRAGAREGWYRLLTPHALRPQAEEMARNPRARSARLRAIEREA